MLLSTHQSYFMNRKTYQRSNNCPKIDLNYWEINGIAKGWDEKFGPQKPRNRGDREIGGSNSNCINLKPRLYIKDMVLIENKDIYASGVTAQVICTGHKLWQL